MKRKIGIFLGLVGLFGVAIGIVMIVLWQIDNLRTTNLATSLEDVAEVSEDPGGESTQDESQIAASDPYWDFIKTDMLSVNFSELKSENPDTVGWLNVSGTNINYPIVQSTDNSYYLNHSFDRSHNSAGWVFLDYRNNLENLSKNTIIYAHGRYDGTMFGSLKNILQSGWLENPANFTVRLSSPSENTLWQVFSVYEIETTSDYLATTFSNDEAYTKFLNLIFSRSAHDFQTSVSPSDRILTLSTCGDESHRIVLHAKLIKRLVR